jgi:hypothetical protein
MASLYYGSYGLIRGYGPLCRTLREADETVLADGRHQRRKGGSTDRNAVAVTPDDGLCWWADEGDTSTADMMPVRTPSGAQARYAQEVIRASEELWRGPKELAGFR